MRLWLLAALLAAAAPLRAAETWASGGWSSAPSAPLLKPADLQPLLLPRVELPLKAGAPDVYPRASDFSGAPRYDQVYVDLKRAASPADVERAARALSPAGKPDPAVLARLNAAVRDGRPSPLTDHMPPAAAALMGQEPSCALPNCFNAAAIWHGRADEQEHMGEDEALAMLFDHFRPLSPGEGLRHGDLIAVHSVDPVEGERLDHLAVYMGQDLVWHKASYHQADPWTFETLSGALKPYSGARRDGTAVGLRLHRRR